MPKPYTQDIRTRVITKHKAGKTVEEIANELSVSLRFVYEMLRLYKITGSVEAKTATGGRKPYLNEERLEQIAVLVQESPDLTLEEIKEELSLDISISVICDAINKKLKLNMKKNSV